MTYEEQRKIREMLANIDKEYLLHFLVLQMEQNHDYEYEKVLATTDDFLRQVKEIEDKYS